MSAYYLKLGSGGDQIPGESRDRYHVGWMKIESVQWGIAGGGATGSSTVAVKEIAMTKSADGSGPALQRACSTGQPFGSAVFEIADPATKRPKTRFDFTDLLVVSYGPSSSPPVAPKASVPIDAFTLQFASVQTNFNPVVEDALDKFLKALGLTK